MSGLDRGIDLAGQEGGPKAVDQRPLPGPCDVALRGGRLRCCGRC
jgi:hypothetical protein